MIYARALLLGIIFNLSPVFASGPLTEGETLDLIRKLEDPHSSDNEHAIHDLANNARSAPELARILRTSPHERVRLRAVRTLAAIRWSRNEYADSAETVSAAVRLAMGDENTKIRCAAIETLSRVRPTSDESNSLIVGALSRKEISPACSLPALANIAEHLKGDNQALALEVSTHLADASPHVRREAARVLGKLGPEAKIAIPALIAALTNSAYEDNGYAVAEVLRNIGTPESTEAARQYTEQQYEISKARAKQYEKERSVFDDFLLSTLSRPVLVCIPIVMLAIGSLSVACLYRWPKTVAAVASLLVFAHWPLAMTIPRLGSMFGDYGGKIGFGIFEVIVSPGFLLIGLIRFMVDPAPNVTALNPLIPITNSFIWGVLVYAALSWYGRRKYPKARASNQ